MVQVLLALVSWAMKVVRRKEKKGCIEKLDKAVRAILYRIDPIILTSVLG